MTEWRQGAVVEWIGEDRPPYGPMRGERGVLFSTGSLDRDPATGDPAEWVVRFKKTTEVFSISDLRLLEDESAEDED